MVDVDGEDGDHDGQRHKNHGEHQVLSDQRDHFGRRGDDLFDNQQEDRQRDQYRRAETDLLPFVGREIEDEHG